MLQLILKDRPYTYYVSKEVGGVRKMTVFADLQYYYLYWRRWVGPKRPKPCWRNIRMVPYETDNLAVWLSLVQFGAQCMPRNRCTNFSIKYYVYFMNENDKVWLLCIRSQYLQKFGLSWWPFLHEYLPGLPKLVPLVILEAIKDKSFRYILTCIQVSALKIITLLFCQVNVSLKLFWLWTDLSTYTFIMAIRVAEFSNGGYKIKKIFA